MTDEKWEKIKDMVEERFGDFRVEEVDTEDGIGKRETLYFISPMGEMKMERTLRPRLVGEKTFTSRRIGASVKVEKEYDEEDMVSYVKGYKMGTNGDWEEIEIPL